jgi:hypothetical protein
MHRVRLIHWKAEEAEERAGWLRAEGYEVDHQPLNPDEMRRMWADPPGAVVIDLSRIPSQGRDLALAIRKRKTTRHVPLVFVEGDAAKLERVKQLLPDAVYTTWDDISTGLAHAIAHPPEEPVVPDSTMAGYSGTPLPKKLGIKAGSVVALVGAPDGFETALGELPEGVTLYRGERNSSDVTLWFTTSRAELEHHVQRMGEFAAKGGLWIIWPKNASGVKSDLTQNTVRQVGLASGLVDFKVSAIDKIWSGLRFTKRKRKGK